MFDHEADLLARMTRDMAEYYSTEAERQHVNGYLKEALRFYSWSKKLFLQYQKMKQPCQKYIDNIDRITQEIQDILPPPRPSHGHDMHSDDDDEKGCEPCS
jgi:hypothetical protein